MSALPPSRAATLRLSALLLALLLAAPRPACAQQGQPITLDDVVDMLQANLNSYEKLIPSFLCEEHLDSTERQYAQRGVSADNYETIAESVFRLKREVDEQHHTASLNESREIKVIDGRPANGRDIDAPSMLSGAFSGGLAVVSDDERECMTYTLEPVKPRKPIVVRFATVPATVRATNCILQEDGSGRVVIDPASMQISRVEFKIPHHVVTPQFASGAKGPTTITKWNVAVDYVPVRLDNRIFWLPKAVNSTSDTSTVEWAFRATYRNYHKLEVTSRIVIPDDDKPPKQ